ncbi:MAG: hypothetical protein U5J83_00090 [Bryobacterales bacterium]|nr:hypothetical protein [Bryobacterales bacterium]
MIQRLLELLKSVRDRRAGALPQALRGTPPVRRLKTYQAETGVTWSYYYEGYRIETEPDAAQCYVFTMLGGNRAPQPLTIVVPDSAMEAIRAQTGASAGSRETYAMAKMHLFSVLDRERQPAADSRFALDSEAALAIWEDLDL